MGDIHMISSTKAAAYPSQYNSLHMWLHSSSTLGKDCILAGTREIDLKTKLMSIECMVDSSSSIAAVASKITNTVIFATLKPL